MLCTGQGGGGVYRLASISGVDPPPALVLKHGFFYFQVQINKNKDYKHAYAF